MFSKSPQLTQLKHSLPRFSRFNIFAHRNLSDSALFSVYENLNRYEFIPIWYKFIPIWYKFIPIWYKFIPGWYWLILEFGCFNLTQNSGPNFGTWMWKNFLNLSFLDWAIGLHPRMIDLVWYKFIPIWYEFIPVWYEFIPIWNEFIPD